MSDNLAVTAELQALKLLLLSVASALPNKDAVVSKYLSRLEELESHALYEAIISDEMRDAIVHFGKQYAAVVQKWNLPNQDKSD